MVSHYVKGKKYGRQRATDVDIRINWTQSPHRQIMEAALAEKRRSPAQKIAAIARQFRIPYEVFRRRVVNEQNRPRKRTASHCGVRAALSKQELNDLAHGIKLLAGMGSGMTTRQVQRYVGDYLEFAKKTNVFKNGVSGLDWVRSWLRKRRDLAKRKGEALSVARARGFTCKAMRHWMRLLDSRLTKYRLKRKPQYIFNCDESGFNLDLKTGKIWAAKGARNVPMIQPGCGKENISVMCCASASGQVFPPMIVFRNKNFSAEKFANVEMYPGTVIRGNDSGWFTAERL